MRGEVGAGLGRVCLVFELEAIDFDVMHSELLGYTELINRLGLMRQTEVAGSVQAERIQRAAGAPRCPQDIAAPPYGPAPPAASGSLETLNALPQPPGPLGALPKPTQSRACSSRRRFLIHLRAPKGFRARSARLRIDDHARSIRIRRVDLRLAATVDLRGLPKETTRVRLTIRGTGRRTIHTSRTYRLCVRSRGGHA